jgi:carbon monoxide dehydrogenase subunit G
MAYEATVPVHRRLLWSAVTDPERLLGAVPNLVVEASSEHGVAARLRLRAGEKSITFRGIARLVDLAPDELRAVVEIEAVHGRADGALDGRVVIRLRPDGDGTRVELEPDFVLSGHSPTVTSEQLLAAGVRLIPRWFAQLAGSAPEPHPAPVTLTVVPEPVALAEPAPSAARFEAEAAADADDDADESGESAALDPAAPSGPESRSGPTFTLITGAGDAQDARPAAKAPLRLVAPSGPEPEDDLPAEHDLWSERRGRFIAPLWVLGAALVGALGLLIALLRRLARRRRDVR